MQKNYFKAIIGFGEIKLELLRIQLMILILVGNATSVLIRQAGL